MRSALALLASGFVAAFLGSAAETQVKPTPPVFPAEANIITVDAVVYDQHGEPVIGLSRGDFIVLEDGQPQAIEAFEEHRRAVSGNEGLNDSGPAGDASPRDSTSTTRLLTFLIDDLGTTPIVLGEVVRAVDSWIGRSAMPTDVVAIVTTSGDVWWSDDIRFGRDDLRAVLRRIKAKAAPRSVEGASISDEEARQIVASESPIRDDDAAARGFTNSRGELVPSGELNPLMGLPVGGQSTSVLSRVARRFLDNRLCRVVEPPPPPPMSQCENLARGSAVLAYQAWTRRAEAVLRSLERLSSELGSTKGRKSIILLSESFVRDDQMEGRYQNVVDAAQRSNTAIYFVGANGLTPQGSGSGGIAATLPGDFAKVSIEEHVTAFAGAESLATSTGGLSITSANDLGAAVERVAVDSSGYYLIGYRPERAPDGRWRRLEVRVAGAKAVARARRGYLAQPVGATHLGPVRNLKAGTAPDSLPTGLTVGAELAAIPLRVATYLRGPSGSDSARILVVVEVQGDRVKTESAGAGGRARLALTVLAVLRDQSKVLPLTQSVELTLRPTERSGWWAFFREVRLPPGVAQMRVQVRDEATGATGSGHDRIEVPDPDAPYLSTPLITDKVQPPLVAGEPSRLVPTARTTFHRQGALLCQYEVFAFGGHGLPGTVQVFGGYSLQRVDGRLVDESPPTRIENDGERVVRRIAFPVSRLEPGEYEVTITVEDRLAKRTLATRRVFTVVEGDTQPATLPIPAAPHE